MGGAATPLLLLLLLAAAVHSADCDDSVEFYFSDFEENLQDLSLLGDAKFVRIEGQADGMAVQVSGTREHTVGRLLYSNPIRMLDAGTRAARSFAAEFCFSMTSYAGDGLVFLITPDRSSIGAPGPWLGVVGGAVGSKADNTFAVEFDSVMNAELLDPNSNHVGLDVETIVSAATANASDIELVLNDGGRKCAWIEFDARDSRLEVRLAAADAADGSEPSAAPPRPAAPLLSHHVRLDEILKPWMYVGFSSSTGNATQKHKIFSWKFSTSSSSSSGSTSNNIIISSSSSSSTSIPNPSTTSSSNPNPSSSNSQQGKHSSVLSSIISSGFRYRSSLLNSVNMNKNTRGDRQDHLQEQEIVADSPGSEEDGGGQSGGGGFDPGLLLLLLVGFTCAACITLFLLVGWALMVRRSDASRLGYEELS